ncbi:type VI secretion system tip protein VgrG, partial [Aromatoleum diolicum]|nr:type VI secretion system tip protein VgrG [Aromatoleum diolicum]
AFEGPGGNPAAAPHLPSGLVSVPPENVEFRYAYHDGEPVKGAEFAARLADGSTRHGRLDERGYLHLENVKPGGVEISVGSDIRPYTNFKLPARPDDDLDVWMKG